MDRVTCGACDFFVAERKLADGLLGGQCRAEPPTAIMQAMPGPVLIGGKPRVQLAVVGYFPPTNSSSWCGRGRRRDGIGETAPEESAQREAVSAQQERTAEKEKRTQTDADEGR